jgi:hypothetical protein
LTDTFSKHATHSVSFIECVVASNEVVGARKEVRFAHVEIEDGEVEDEDEGGKEMTALKPRRPPIMSRGVCWSIFIYMQ